MRIFLVGFMGSGKSHWGKIWAEQNAYRFIDLDEMIEEDQQMGIAKIFEERGEPYFREIETVVLKKNGSAENCILACGGGTPCFFGNMQWMNEQGVTLYLRLNPQELMENVRGEKIIRPLIRDLEEAELLLYIEKKLLEREPYYLQARYILSAHELHPGSLAALNLLH
jgi:shikimate kinase